MIESAGAAALTVHGRTAQDFFKGSADWDRISAIKPHLKRIPLIGNGDLDSPAKVVAAFERYDVDGVMIARAALSKPWLFRQAQAALRGEPVPPDPSLEEERNLLLFHYDLVCQRFGAAGNDPHAPLCVLLRPRATRGPRVSYPGFAGGHARGIRRHGARLLPKVCSPAARGRRRLPLVIRRHAQPRRRWNLGPLSIFWPFFFRHGRSR